MADDARRSRLDQLRTAGVNLSGRGFVTGFLGLLAQVELGAVDVRAPVLVAVRRVPELVSRRRVLAKELDGTLVTGAWRRLVFANPEPPAGVADHRAYIFCVLERLHRGLQRRQI